AQHVLGHGRLAAVGQRAIVRAVRPGARICGHKKAPDVSIRGSSWQQRSAQNLDLVSLHAFLALHCFEGDLLAFFQATEAGAFDSTEVHEQIRTALGSDEAEALLVVEPFDGAGLTIRHCLISLKLELMTAFRAL